MTMTDVSVEVGYLAVGANRQTAAADWSLDGTLCFGAGVNLALWRPTVCEIRMLQSTPVRDLHSLCIRNHRPAVSRLFLAGIQTSSRP